MVIEVMTSCPEFPFKYFHMIKLIILTHLVSRIYILFYDLKKEVKCVNFDPIQERLCSDFINVEDLREKINSTIQKIN